MNERVLTSIQVIRKNVPYFTASAKLCFTSTIRSLGNHCFLPSLANRMIRMSKDEEIEKKYERNHVPEGSRVKVNLNRTLRTLDQ